MEIKDTNFKKVIASEGMAVKWYENRWNHLHKRYEVSESYSPYDTPALKAHSFRGGMKTQTDASR